MHDMDKSLRVLQRRKLGWSGRRVEGREAVSRRVALLRVRVCVCMLRHFLPVSSRLLRVRGLHAGAGGAALSSHPKITTHPSVVPRETDPRWEGKCSPPPSTTPILYYITCINCI